MSVTDIALTQPPIMVAKMIIRKPVAEVFEAFVDPAITARFWFTKGSGRLEAGRTVRWDWEVYNVGTDVRVNVVEAPRQIVIEWESEGGATTVEWQFQPVDDHKTFVTITESGFHGDGDALVRQALDSTQGFNLVLAGAKAWLEHGIYLNLVADHTVEGSRSID
jgi:uncharacterized protein YndB with AHSA1/START domain